MVRLLLVDNYDNSHSERALRLKASLTKKGAKVQVTDCRGTNSAKLRDFDGAVLSGSYDMLSEVRAQRKFAGEIALLQDATQPILGVCFGHQLLGFAFGSRVVRSHIPSKGYTQAQIVKDDALFNGLRSAFGVYESHYEVVESLPRQFTHLARSPGAEFCAMKHASLPIYGVQFHPERNSSMKPDDDVVLANFVRGVETG